MRIRCSKGLCVDEYLMGLPLPGAQEVDIAGIDADSAFAVTLRHDDKLEGLPHRVSDPRRAAIVAAARLCRTRDA